jgi:hypothetical protein
MLICGIAGTTLSIGIFSCLIKSPKFAMASGSLILAAMLFLVSSIFSMTYIEIWDESEIMVWSGVFILCGLAFIFVSIYKLYELLKLSTYAYMTGQIDW